MLFYLVKATGFRLNVFCELDDDRLEPRTRLIAARVDAAKKTFCSQGTGVLKQLISLNDCFGFRLCNFSS